MHTRQRKLKTEHCLLLLNACSSELPADDAWLRWRRSLDVCTRRSGCCQAGSGGGCSLLRCCAGGPTCCCWTRCQPSSRWNLAQPVEAIVQHLDSLLVKWEWACTQFGGLQD
jgi:hypothetical protein